MYAAKTLFAPHQLLVNFAFTVICKVVLRRNPRDRDLSIHSGQANHKRVLRFNDKDGRPQIKHAFRLVQRPRQREMSLLPS